MLIALVSVAIILSLSWGVSTLLVWLICLCFGWSFSLLIGTGIWLIMLLLSSVFKPTNEQKTVYSTRPKR
jgi:hypothetical protein